MSVTATFHQLNPPHGRLAEMTDEDLRALEGRLYADEAEGQDSWAERDAVLNEMIRRGMI